LKFDPGSKTTGTRSYFCRQFDPSRAKDKQKMQNSEVSGVEYQQGVLAGYEVRETK